VDKIIMLKSVQIVFLKDISGIFIISHIRQTQCLQDLPINSLTWLFAAYKCLRLYSRCGISIQRLGLYSPSPEYPAARAAQALAPRVLQG
jgi:hypothetical protein